MQIIESFARINCINFNISEGSHLSEQIKTQCLCRDFSLTMNAELFGKLLRSWVKRTVLLINIG